MDRGRHTSPGGPQDWGAVGVGGRDPTGRKEEQLEAGFSQAFLENPWENPRRFSLRSEK